MVQISAEHKRALTQAVETIELGSGAEVVISLKPRSTPVSVPASYCALGGMLLGLAFLLFSPWSFSYAAIWVDTALCGGVAYLACCRSASLQRLCTPASQVAESVARSAEADFTARGIVDTRERSGILVYVSMLERRARVMADRGVRKAVDPELFQAVVADIERVVREGADLERLAHAVKGLLPVLAQAFPRREDDTNELGDGL